MIFALALLFPYIRFYRYEHANIVAGKGIWDAMVAHPYSSSIFCVLTVCWVALTINALIHYRRTKRLFGGYLGSFLGHLVILAEYLGYASIMAVLFMNI